MQLTFQSRQLMSDNHGKVYWTEDETKAGQGIGDKELTREKRLQLA